MIAILCIEVVSMVEINFNGFDELEKALKKATRYIDLYCPNCSKKFKVDTKKRVNKCPRCKLEVTTK